MLDGLKEKIEELAKSMTGCKSVMYGKKSVGGVLTDTPAVVFSVEEKKLVSEVPPEQLVPSTVVANGNAYATDVVEDKSEIKALACYPFDDPEVIRLQGNPSLITPVRGGQEIIQFPTGWTSSGLSSWQISAGTLGFICVDNEDGRPVGVTNAHVGCGVFLKNSKRSLSSESVDAYNLYDTRLFSPTSIYRRPGAVVRNGDSVVVSNPFSPNIKRYTPMDRAPNSENNYLDACIMSINELHLDDNSHKIHQPIGTSDLNGGAKFAFATTAEIDGLLSSNPRLYSTGRTTGPKGWGSCQLVVDALFASASVVFEYLGVNVSVPFADLIRFRYQDSSNFPLAGGDSGSAVLAEIGGQVKIIGLAFAGNGGSPSNPSSGTHHGYACRIDRMASELNIRAWDSSYVRIASVGTAHVLTQLYGAAGVDAKTVIVNGQKYYNIGLTNSSEYDSI